MALVLIIWLRSCRHSRKKSESFVPTTYCGRFIYCLAPVRWHSRGKLSRTIYYLAQRAQSTVEETLFLVGKRSDGGEIYNHLRFECGIYVKNPLLKCHFYMIYSFHNQTRCTRERRRSAKCSAPRRFSVRSEWSHLELNSFECEFSFCRLSRLIRSLTTISSLDDSIESLVAMRWRRELASFCSFRSAPTTNKIKRSIIHVCTLIFQSENAAAEKCATWRIQTSRASLFSFFWRDPCSQTELRGVQQRSLGHSIHAFIKLFNLLCRYVCRGERQLE